MASLQIIFNVFRRKPIEAIFAKAKQRGVAIIVRLPLASGLLAGKFKKDTQFVAADHRNFNRDGQAFNVGETFAGLPFELGVDLAEELKQYTPDGATMAQWALRWCLDFDAVTTVIPGARSPQQARDNAMASALDPIPTMIHTQLKRFYDEKVHANIRGKY
jgi:aryl-alcohol dehydrogenase-like predicted oxidoreductase